MNTTLVGTNVVSEIFNYFGNSIFHELLQGDISIEEYRLSILD